MILPYILKTIWWTNIITGILVPCDTKIYLIKCMLVSYLHFMVQWFCLVSWRLLDGWISYWRYWFSVARKLTWTYKCRSVTYISQSSDFVLFLKTIWWTNVIIGIFDPPDAKIYHIKCMSVSDLHFMILSFFMEECCTDDIDSLRHLLVPTKYMCWLVTYS